MSSDGQDEPAREIGSFNEGGTGAQPLTEEATLALLPER